MRIPCPFCGPRELSEFTYLGDAAPVRPDGADDADAVFDYVYLRTNSAGAHRERWYHAAGCRLWLTVTRDTRTHAILDAEEAAP